MVILHIKAHKLGGFQRKKFNAHRHCSISFRQTRKVALCCDCQQQHLASAQISFHIKAKLTRGAKECQTHPLFFPRLFCPPLEGKRERRSIAKSDSRMQNRPCRRQKVDLVAQIYKSQHVFVADSALGATLMDLLR